MTYRPSTIRRLNRVAVLISSLTLYSLVGCSSGSEDALPGDGGNIKHDSAKRDTVIGSGGTSEVVDTAAYGGSSGDALGDLGTGGTGGSTSGIVDSGTGRDVLPDLPVDAVRVVDVGFGIEAFVGKDASEAEALPIDTAVHLDSSAVQSDSPSGPDSRDSADAAQESGPEVNYDVPADSPVTLPEVGPETSPDTRDASTAPSCSNPAWAKSWGLPNQGWLAGDKEGNLFVANSAMNDLNLGGTAATVTNAGNSDAVVVRFDPTSGSPVWAKGFGDAKAQTATGVAVDKSGHVGIIGNYLGAITIGTSSLSNLGDWSYGYVGGLQAADGAGLWAISASLSADNGSSGTFMAIAANPNWDDFVVCGKANIAATDLNVIGKTPLASGGGYDIVVAKIKGSDGSIMWSRQLGATGDQSCTAAAVDDSGDVLIAGGYYGTLDFGSGALSPAATAGNLIPWVAKLSGSDGATMAAMNPTPGATGRTGAVVYSIDTDSSGNVVIAGTFKNALTFGSTTTLTSAGLNDAFVAKVGSTLAGSTLTPLWAMRWGDASHSQYAEAAAFDSSGNVTVVGQFIGTIDIGPAGAVLTAASDATSSNTDIFLARLSGSTGASTCAVRYGDPLSQEAYNLVVPRSATTATKDVTFVAGLQTQFSTLNFGSVTLDTTNSPDSADLWLARF
jgi:hypothetical protein